MRVQKSDFGLGTTHEYVFDDFSRGSNLVLEESRQQEEAPGAFLLATDMEILPGGGLTRRDGVVSYPLIAKDTALTPGQAAMRLVRFNRVNALPILCLLTPSSLYRLQPYYSAWNLEEVYDEAGLSVFTEQARSMDVEVFANKLYVASPHNTLVQWDGSNPATHPSEDWEENYRMPTVIRRHAGRLFCTGFSDLRDSRAASDIRYTEMADASNLALQPDGSPALLEVRTSDDDTPTAMGSFMLSDISDSTKAILAIWKKHSTHVLLGDSFGDPAGLYSASNLVMRTLSTLRGCTGPAAWCAGAKGLYFHDKTGIFCLSGPAQVEEVSFAISPCWAGRVTSANLAYPRITSENDMYATLCYDAKKRSVFCLLPMEVP
jgi:hypothetical protein